jgi:hypothetical protein
MYNLSTVDNTSGDARSLSAAFSPGILGLFVQGLETGLVLSQLSSWLSFPECTESRLVIILTAFVTTLDLWVYCLLYLSISLLLIRSKACKQRFPLPLLGKNM